MNYLDLLPKVTVIINDKLGPIGSGVYVKIHDSFYVLTAAHVIYQKNGDLLPLKDITLRSEVYGELKVDTICGDRSAHYDFDMVPIKVLSEGHGANFPIAEFCEKIDYPQAAFIFRGRPESISEEIYSVDPCYVNSLPGSSGRFSISIPGERYSNAIGESGYEILKGYSGSGLFARDTDRFLLVGLVVKVNEDDFSGVVCISIEKLKQYFFPELTLSEFHGANKGLKLSIASLRKEITQKLISERKEKKYGDVENLIKKMNVFLGDWNTEDLDGFINDILLWEKFDQKRIRNNPEYQDLIDEAKAQLAAGNKQFKVDSIASGNDKFHKIQEEFLNIVKDELEGTPLKSNSRVIATGEVAKMLANCKLGFDFTDEN